MKFYVPYFLYELVDSEEDEIRYLMPAHFESTRRRLYTDGWADGSICESSEDFLSFFFLRTSCRFPIITDQEYTQLKLDGFAFLSSKRYEEFIVVYRGLNQSTINS